MKSFLRNSVEWAKMLLIYSFDITFHFARLPWVFLLLTVLSAVLSLNMSMPMAVCVCVCVLDGIFIVETNKNSQTRRIYYYLKQCNRMCITAYRKFSRCEAEREIKCGWLGARLGVFK